MARAGVSGPAQPSQEAGVAAAADPRTQARLSSLVEVNRSIVAELSLAALLRRIVEAARSVAHAEYAALGVVSPDGQLDQFVHSGMTKDAVATIGELPRGRGVLGALISDPRPIRLTSISDHPRSSGFPATHPSMGSFLGVPIQSRGEIYGNLYLTNRVDAAEFTAEDEELVVAIAATAGVAIENARLYEDSRRQQEWLRASADISRELLQETTTATQILTHVADTVRRLAAADVVSVVFPGATAGTLTVQIARGHQARELLGHTYAAAGSLAGEAMSSGQARLLSADHGGYFVHLQSAFDVGPVMACPLVGEAGVRAAVMVGRKVGSPAFTQADLKTAEAFTNHAAIGLELNDRREGERRLEVLEDRARIARDLHDHVIQRLFATGLTIQAAAVRCADPVLTAKLQAAVDGMDDTIRQIRTSIFELQDQHADGADSPRAALIDVVASVEPALGFVPHLTFAGAVDTLIRPDVLDDAEAVVREGLTNIAKHADATRVDISVVASSRHLTIEIADDGSVAPTGDRRSGLANLERRAQLRRGACSFLHDEGGGRLRWTAALGN